MDFFEFNYVDIINDVKYSLKFPFLTENVKTEIGINGHKIYSYVYWSNYSNNIKHTYFINIFINAYILKQTLSDYKIRLYIYRDNLPLFINCLKQINFGSLIDIFQIIECSVKPAYKSSFPVPFFMAPLRFMPLLEKNVEFHCRDLDSILSVQDILIINHFKTTGYAFYNINFAEPFEGRCWHDTCNTNPFLAGMFGGNTSISVVPYDINNYLDSFYNYYVYILLLQIYHGPKRIKQKDIEYTSHLIDELILSHFFVYLYKKFKTDTNLFYSYNSAWFLNRHINAYYDKLLLNNNYKCFPKVGKEINVNKIFDIQNGAINDVHLINMINKLKSNNNFDSYDFVHLLYVFPPSDYKDFNESKSIEEFNKKLDLYFSGQKIFMMNYCSNKNSQTNQCYINIHANILLIREIINVNNMQYYLNKINNLDNTIIIKNNYGKCGNIDYQMMNNYLKNKEYCTKINFANPSYYREKWNRNIDENKFLKMNMCNYKKFNSENLRKFNYDVSYLDIIKNGNNVKIDFIVNNEKENFDLIDLNTNNMYMKEGFIGTNMTSNTGILFFIVILIIMIIIGVIIYHYSEFLMTNSIFRL